MGCEIQASRTSIHIVYAVCEYGVCKNNIIQIYILYANIPERAKTKQAKQKNSSFSAPSRLSDPS